ncbi:MAG TPA: hypothetical protein VGF79_00940 [Bacteroidia bacterium]
MINVRELRLGNWVSLLGDFHQIDGIYLDFNLGSVHLEGNAIYNNADKIEPIPITEEILLKCGFEKKEEIGKYIGYSNVAISIWHNKVNNTFLVDNISKVEVYIEHLHQLQNLIYALSGQELEINL